MLSSQEFFVHSCTSIHSPLSDVKLVKANHISQLCGQLIFWVLKNAQLPNAQDEIYTFTVLKTSLAPSFTSLSFSLIYSCWSLSS